MTDNTLVRKSSLIVRVACVIGGAGLSIWAFSDHPSIGGGIGFGLFQAAILGLGLLTIAAAFLPIRWASAYLSIFIVTFLSLCAIELILQAKFRPYYFTTYEYDERLLFKLKQGSSGVLTHAPEFGGATVHYRVNSDGYVGPELRDPPAETRVLVYGDSFIHANYTPFENRFTTVLQDHLTETTGQDVEVINAGISGYGPDQILRRMQTELDKVNPDFLIVSIFSGNDFGDLLRNRMYDLEPDGTLIERAFVLTPEQARQGRLNESELVLIRVIRRALGAFSGSETASEPFDAEGWIDWAMTRHLEEYESFIAGDNTVGDFAVDPYSTDIAVSPESDSAVLKIRLMDALIGNITEIATEKEVPLLFLVVPHPMDLLNGNHSSGRINSEKYPNYDPTNLTGILETLILDRDQEILNLYPVLQTDNVNDLFLKGGDDHWNANGQAKAAGATAEEIIRLMD